LASFSDIKILPNLTSTFFLKYAKKQPNLAKKDAKILNFDVKILPNLTPNSEKSFHKGSPRE
jgi:hypothetical protein